MEYYNVPALVPVKPDKEEKKRIRRKYIKVGFVIVLNTILFNYIMTNVFYIIASVLGEGDTPRERLTEWFGRNPGTGLFFSCLVPILSETVSIIFGAKLLKTDLKKLFTFNGFTGKELTRSVVISLGVHSLSTVVIALLAVFLDKIGLELKAAGISPVSSVGASVFLYFYGCLLGPFLEELLYRGVILQGLSRYNERFGIIVSSLIFGLMHQNYQQFVLGFMVGLILAAVDLRSGSLIPSIVIHVLLNSLNMLSALIIQNSDYAAYESIVNGETDLGAMSPAFLALAMLTLLIRFIFLIAGMTLMMIEMTKKRSIRLPTPAGKSRGWPVLAQSWIWYVIGAGYIYLTFIAPMGFKS